MTAPARLISNLILALFAALPANAAEVTFETHILPIFEKNCAGCHSPSADRLKAGLDLSSAEKTLKGSEYGEIVRVGDSAQSFLIKTLEHTEEPHMPPPDKFKKLSQEEIDLIKQWIDTGAASASVPVEGEPQTANPAPESETGTPESASAPESGEHAAPIASLAYSPDGKTLAVGSLHTVELYSVENPAQPEKIGTLEDHADLVRALEFSPDGTLLAAAGGKTGRSGEILLWNVDDRTLKSRIEGHDDNILDLAWSPDQTRLVTGSYDKTVALWNAESGQRLHRMTDHVDAVYTVAWSPDGKQIVSGAGDRTLKVWDGETAKRLMTLSDSTDAVRAAAFSPDNRFLAGGADDKMIRIWDLAASAESFSQSQTSTGVLLHSKFSHEGPVLGIAYSPDGTRLFSTGNDRMVKAWVTENMIEHAAFPAQPDWVFGFALSPDGTQLALGRFDGTWGIFSAEDARSLFDTAPVLDSQLAEGQRDAKTALVKGKGSTGRIDVDAVIIDGTIPPGITSINPVRWHRGSDFEMTVEGKNLADAHPFFFDSRVQVTVLESEALPIPEFNYDPDSTGAQIFDYAQPYRYKLKVALPEDLPLNSQHLAFETPIGLSNTQALTILPRPDVGEAEPNNRAEEAQVLAEKPSTVIGAINEAGDVDRYALESEEGEEVVCVLTDTQMNMTVRILDEEGKVLASSENEPNQTGNPTTAWRAGKKGTLYLEVSDPEVRAGIGYRLHIGHFPYVRRISPLGIPAGGPSKVAVEGFNIEGKTELEIDPPDTVEFGHTEPLPIPAYEGNPASSPRIAVGPYEESLEEEPNDSLAEAQLLGFPSTVNGRIEKRETGEDLDLYRFAGKQGETLCFEIQAARLGSDLDSVVEILDSQGNFLHRANARCVAETFMTLSDRDSRQSGLRLDDWSDLKINDYMMVGSEIFRIEKIPDYGDEDVIFQSFHNGQRIGMFGTTPEHHAVNTPVYRVEIHPTNRTFPPNGMPMFPIHWRNDDAFFDNDMSKDSQIVFEVPANGEYFLKVSDTIATGGERHQYRLTARPLRPDFKIFAEEYRVNVAEGGSVPVGIRIQRYDGFAGPVEVWVEQEDLAEGISIAPDTVLPDQERLNLAVVAAHNAASMTEDRAIRIMAKALIDGKEIVRQSQMGRITVVDGEPDVVVQNDLEVLEIQPGTSSWLTVKVDRNNDFSSRVPIEVLNLPLGVRVLDTGLNGILIREGETERKMEIYVEPWVEPLKKKIYVRAQVEPRSPGRMVFIGPAIELVTEMPEPAKTGPS